MKAPAFLAAAAIVILSGCDRPVAPSPPTPSKSAVQEGYRAPPGIVGSARTAAGVTLRGEAEPLSRVRLGAPTGEAVFAQVDARGAWSVDLPASPQAQIFGLSSTKDDEGALQAKGYVFIAPTGEAVLLQAGGGAMRTAPGRPTRIAAADFDAQGGLVVSGVAPPEVALSLRVDRRAMAEGRSDSQGRFVLASPQPFPAGSHQIEVLGDAVRAQAVVTLSAQPALEGRPFWVAPTPEGLRVDWMTPGGGQQSTLLLN